MGDRFAAASLEFRRASAGHGPRCSLEQEAARAHASPAAERAQIRADRDAEKQRGRLYHGVFCSRWRLCDDLAHLVDGRCGGNRNLSYHACLRVSQRRGNRNSGRADCPVRAGEPGGGCSMNIAVAVDDEVRHEVRPSASEAGPAAKRIVVGYGFWVFLLSDILTLAAEKAGWDRPLPSGRGRGVSVQFAFGSYLAEVAEVEVAANGSLKVHRIVCAVDCGMVVNPDTIEAQVQGGTFFGLTAALYGAITLKNGRVEQGNFDTYRPLRIDEAPVVETHLVKSSEAPGGFGEAPTAVVAPAVTNAIFAATAKRIRTLPIDTNLLKFPS